MSSSMLLAEMSDMAADQWGLLTSAQATRLGASGNDLARLLSRRVVRRIRHGVYALAGAPASRLEGIRAEWLATDPDHTVSERSRMDDPVLVCDETAATIYSIGDFTPSRIRLNAHRRLQTSQPTVQISRRTIPTADWQLVDGLPMTTPRRTLEDLASSGRWDVDHIATAILDALNSHLLTAEEVGKSLVLRPAAPHLADQPR